MVYKICGLIKSITSKIYSLLRTSIILLVTFSVIFNVSAKGLGMMDIRSSANEPFDAMIPISPNTNIDTLKVKLANKREFNAKGIIREDFIDQIKVEIIKSKDGGNIRLSSATPIFTSFFTVLLEINEGGEKDIYSALLDFDAPSPIVSLIFGTQAVEGLANTKHVKVKMDINKDVKYEEAKVKAEQQKQNEILSDDGLLDNSDLAPEDSRVFKSKLYRKIINKSAETMNDIYIPSSNSPTKRKVNNTEHSFEKQAYRSKLKTLNQSISDDDISNVEYNDEEFFQVAMGNPSVEGTLNMGQNNYKNNAFAQVDSTRMLWVISIVLFLFLMSIFYNNIRQRRKLQEVYLGDFDKISTDGERKPYSKKFHRVLKDLLNNGEFNEATELFQHEFRRRGMSLYELCQYYGTFQEYGITEFTADMFLQESLDDPIMLSESTDNQKDDNVDRHQVPLHEGKVKGNSSKTVKSPSLKTKVSKENEFHQENIDLSGVADDILTAKLNLGSAYMNMGDSVKARNILNEVCKNGNAQQRKEANRLLKKLNH